MLPRRGAPMSRLGSRAGPRSSGSNSRADARSSTRSTVILPAAEPFAGPMRGDTPEGVMSLGPLRLLIGAEAELGRCVERLASGVVFESAASHRVGVRVALTTVGGSRRGLPRLPHFRSRERDGVLADASEGWEATIREERGEVWCDFGLVDVDTFGSELAPTLRELNVAAALRVALGLASPVGHGLLLHAAGLALDERGVVFLGASGQGKSTMARRLPGWIPLADDAVLVWREGGQWFVSGTILPGRERSQRRVRRVALTALVALEKNAKELVFERVSAIEALVGLMPRVLYHADPDERVLGLAHELVMAVPGFILRSDLSHDVAGLLAERVVATGRAT
jgi:hypothetical protein